MQGESRFIGVINVQNDLSSLTLESADHFKGEKTNHIRSTSIINNNRVPLGIESNSVAIGYRPKFAKGFMLSVDGKTITEELQVQSSGIWPDYVFEPGYNLLPIAELDTYLKENKHLPNIPSAQEIKENDGFLVGEMNKKLLEKVEELSLYIIELHQRIEKLENK